MKWKKNITVRQNLLKRPFQPALNYHSKIDIKYLMTNGSLMTVESTAPLGAFCKTFDVN